MVIYCDTTTKVNILNKQFTSVFTQEVTANLPEISNTPYSPVPDITVHQAGVIKLLTTSTQIRPLVSDNIPGNLLKELDKEIVPILTIIFNVSIQKVRIPDQKKKALTTSKFKKETKERLYITDQSL